MIAFMAFVLCWCGDWCGCDCVRVLLFVFVYVFFVCFVDLSQFIIAVGTACAVWGCRKTRARRALAVWPHTQEHTNVGDMVSLDVGLIIHGLPDDD